MITAWKNNEKSKARAAQDEAALELARKVGEEPDEELESDDEPPGEGDDPSDSAPKGSGGDGDTTADNMREVTQAHFDSLSGVTVTHTAARETPPAQRSGACDGKGHRPSGRDRRHGEVRRCRCCSPWATCLCLGCCVCCRCCGGANGERPHTTRTTPHRQLEHKNTTKNEPH